MNSLESAQARILELEQRLACKQRELEDARQMHSGNDDKITSKMQHLLNLLPAGVVLIGVKGTVVDSNPAARELLGEPLNGELWMAIIQRSFAPKGDDGHEVSLKDGRRVSLSTRALADGSGQLVLLTNLTETRLLQARLAHYQRLSEMGRMMASLAHQIRTPLSSALLYADHLNRPDLHSDQRLKFAAKVKSRLGQLEHQVRDMLVFARAETRLDDRISTSELLSSLEDLLDVPLTQFDADCECVNDAPGLVIQCNKEILLGVVMNLVENALQACSKDAQLIVKFTVLTPSQLSIQVCDNGPGMTPEQVKRVVEPFYTTKSHGTGLGLAVAQVVTKAHGGDFRIESQLEKGTCAQIIIPAFSGESRKANDSANSRS